MTHFDRFLQVRIDGIESTLQGIESLKTEGKNREIISRFSSLGVAHLEIGLFRWRHGESPLADFKTGLHWAERTIVAISELLPIAQPGEFDSHNWAFFRTVAFLSNRHIDTPSEKPAEKLYILDHADRILAKALADFPYRNARDAMLAKLSGIKRLKREYSSMQTYFAILDTEENGQPVDELIEQAEKLFRSRAKVEAGAAYNGYDIYNDFVPDWQLAAVLKKVGWQGESIHRWNWN
jgi:hypothetical protein